MVAVSRCVSADCLSVGDNEDSDDNVESTHKPGDTNGDGGVNSDDAILRLRHTLSAGRFPIIGSGDMNGDGAVNSDDAIYLLRHTLAPSRFPLGCAHVSVIDDAVEPTCTETGLSTGEHCSKCGKVLVAQILVDALGHDYVDGVCSRCGKNEPSEGLAFTSNGDGTCYVSGIGTCTDTDIVIPELSPNGDRVTSIGNQAFQGRTNLTNVIIPDSVTSIGNRAFYGCTGLTSICIPQGVTRIGTVAFLSCTSLINVEIPSSVTSIGGGAFWSCTALMSIIVDTDNTVYHSDGNCLIETASKTLIVGCKTSVIPTDGSVTSIGHQAFYGCTGLTSIDIPNGVTSIDINAFERCTGLTSIDIPDSVTSIGHHAFSGCTALRLKIRMGGTP